MKALARTYKNERSGKAVANALHNSSGTVIQKRPFHIQTKLSIGQPNDKYEQEADAVADNVMRMSEPTSVQRSCPNCRDEEVRTRPIFHSITPLVQRQSFSEEDEQAVQSKPDTQSANLSIENSINQNQGHGSVLPDDTRSFMESRFGTDFSNVRVHNDSKAAQLNKQLNAQAFTKGNDIYFNNGKNNLESIEGKHLLAHELTHVIQQDQSIRRQIPGRIIAPTVPASIRAQKLFAWMELPLQAVVISPSKIDKKNWSDDAIAGLVLIYNEMRNENIWQYVKEVIDTSPIVSIDFIPKSGPAFIYNQLFKHNYINCLSDYGTVWGLRKKKACGAHLHFKYFNKTKNEINVHIDEVDPCCGNIPILSRIYYGLKHYFVDKRGWDKRKVGNFITLLKNQKIPLSTGILKHLKKMR